MNSKQGFVFVQVLCICLMMGLLATPMIHRNFLEIQMNRSLHTANQQFYTVESALHEAEKKIGQGNCSVPSAYPQKIDDNRGCTFVLGETVAHYVVETLDHDPCAEDINTHQRGIDYFRITAWASDSRLQMQTVLQTTWAQLSASYAQDCRSVVHNVALGRQSWRKIAQ